MNLIKSFLWTCSFYGFLTLYSPVVLFCLPFKKITEYNAKFIMNALLFLLKYTVGITYKVYGTIPNQAIFASKHMSTMDVILLCKLVKKPVFIMKKELGYVPIYGWFFLRLGFISLDRKKGGAAMRLVKEQMEKRIAEGYSPIIFPEGTRVLPGVSNQFKRGILFFAENLNIKIVPVGLNTGLFWKKNQLLKKSGEVSIYFEQPQSLDFDSITQAIQKHSA